MEHLGYVSTTRYLTPRKKLDLYLIMRIDKCINSQSDNTVLLTLNGNSLYWQMTIDEEDSNKAILNLHYGLNKFIRILYRF